MSDLYFWAVLFVVAIGTSIISGILGMAGGLLLLVALLVRLEPVVAIPIHGIVQLVSNGSRAWFLRREVRWGAVLRFAWPLVPAGVLCGAFVIVRSQRRSRRAPGANPKPTFATVAGDAILSNDPLTVSFLPLSVATALPRPAT